MGVVGTVPAAPAKAGGVSHRQIEGGEGVVLNLRTGDYYTLNPVGLRIWEMIDGKRRAEAMAQAITKEYRVEGKRALQDTRVFLQSLGREGLLRGAGEVRGPAARRAPAKSGVRRGKAR